MKTIGEMEERIQKHIKDPGDNLMIQCCEGVHPLMLFIPDYYKPECKKDCLPLTEEAVIAEMKDYIDFAFGKAYGERGISSERSIWKFQQWLWLLEDYELLAFAYDDTNYPDYGLPILRKIAEKYKFTDPRARAQR